MDMYTHCTGTQERGPPVSHKVQAISSKAVKYNWTDKRRKYKISLLLYFSGKKSNVKNKSISVEFLT